MEGNPLSALLLALLFAPVAGTVDDSQFRFKLGIEHDGAYRIDYDALEYRGRPVPIDHVAVVSRGAAIPIWVNDDGDGLFGPGDSIELLGAHLPGDRSHFNEHARDNVYWLLEDGKRALRFNPATATIAADDLPTPEVHRHLERDKLRVRFRPARNAPSPEIWYWERLSHISDPFAWELDLGNEASATRPIVLRAELRGWSTLNARESGGLAHHRVELHLNDQLLAHVEWDGQDAQLLEARITDSSLLAGERNRLELRVPKRSPGEDAEPVIDVVLLNWVQIEQPLDASLLFEQLAVTAPQPARLPSADARDVLFSPDQRRIALAADESGAIALDRPGEWLVVRDEGFLTPSWIEADRTSSLAETDQQADYLMIAHGSLIEAVRPLAAFHERRGLSVELVNVTDIYDEFNHGIQSPQAIRDFIAHAYNNWQSPRPRYVLLVGDASWDVHNDELKDEFYADWTFKPGEKARFRKNSSTPYENQIAQRNLVPTWGVETYEGLAASDNPFVTVDGDDWLPDMAIGRMPIAMPEEATAIVDKVIAYANLAEVGPWRRNVLWITNEQRHFQNLSDGIAGQLAQQGYGATKVYPSPQEKNNEQHQAELREAFDEGQLLVHFLGHGGRYIWRTGPPDFRKNHDLFTLDDIEQLSPNPRLPLVLSMTCYSAPFDHPTADSIGEKFLRLPNRGAIGVLAASWRNSPTHRFSESLMRHLTTPGMAIGEAIMRAKQSEPSKVMVETYNLLGDPALPLALPADELDLNIVQDDAQLSVQTDVQSGLGEDARFIVDWLGVGGETLASTEASVEDERLTANYRLTSTEPRPVTVRVYFWNPSERIDAFGAMQIPALEAVAAE